MRKFLVLLFPFAFGLLSWILCFVLLQKQYAALVWISRPLEDDDLQSLTSDKEMVSVFLFPPKLDDTNLL